MSILIHGKMPTKGKLPTESTFQAWFYPSGVVAFYDSDGNSLGTSEWKELPPHGRLKDVDKLHSNMYEWDGLTGNYYINKEQIESAPTIIESEEE